MEPLRPAPPDLRPLPPRRAETPRLLPPPDGTARAFGGSDRHRRPPPPEAGPGSRPRAAGPGPAAGRAARRRPIGRRSPRGSPPPQGGLRRPALLPAARGAAAARPASPSQIRSSRCRFTLCRSMGRAGPRRPSALRRDAPSLAAAGSREEAEGPGRGPAATEGPPLASASAPQAAAASEARRGGTGAAAAAGPPGPRGSAELGRARPPRPGPASRLAAARWPGLLGPPCRERRGAAERRLPEPRLPGRAMRWSSTPKIFTRAQNAHTSSRNRMASCAVLQSAASAATGATGVGHGAAGPPGAGDIPFSAFVVLLEAGAQGLT